MEVVSLFIHLLSSLVVLSHLEGFSQLPKARFLEMVWSRKILEHPDLGLSSIERENVLHV